MVNGMAVGMVVECGLVYGNYTFYTKLLSLSPRMDVLVELRGLLQDVTLIILLVSAIVSLALSFYRPPDDGSGGMIPPCFD